MWGLCRAGHDCECCLHHCPNASCAGFPAPYTLGKVGAAKETRHGRPVFQPAGFSRCPERQNPKALLGAIGWLEITRCWKPWWVTGGYAQSVQQALSARSGGGLAAAWERGVQAGSAKSPASYLKVCAML